MRRSLIFGLVAGMLVFALLTVARSIYDTQASSPHRSVERTATDRITNQAAPTPLAQRSQSPAPTSFWPARLPLIFSPDKLLQDRAYRLIVWEYWVNRKLDSVRRVEPKLNQVTELLRANGIREPLLTDFVNTVYFDSAFVQMFETHAEDAKRDHEARAASIKETGGESEGAEDQLRRSYALYQHMEEHWLMRADTFKQWAVERFQRETGITDDNFCQELFAIRFDFPASGGISTHMADNEELFPSRARRGR